MDTKAPHPAEMNREGLNASLIPEVIEERCKDPEGRYVVSRYSRGRLLGKGGFAKCYIGTLASTKRTYALKIVAKSTLAKTRAKQKVHLSRILSKRSHRVSCKRRSRSTRPWIMCMW